MWKKIIAITFLLIVGILVGAIVWNYPKLGVVSAYNAKKMCSCTFIAERSQESIQKEDLGTSPLNLADHKIDRNAKRVTSSVFGINPKTAEYRGRLGCVLLEGNDDHKVKFPDTEIEENNLPDLPFPYGDKIEKIKVQGVDYASLTKAANEFFDPDGGMTELMTRSLLVLYKDSLILEKYANGYDENTEVIGWSMTKSLMNCWVGMMVKDGKISISDQNLFEEWENDDRKNISLKDLLHMESGLKWDEVYHDLSTATTMLYNSEDNGSYALNQPKEFEPGTHWEYSSGTSNIISKYLRRQFENHEDYLKYPYERIFHALNMDNTIMETDEAGGYIGSSYCYATTRDWARFGTLFLKDGVWNGERLLPEGWVAYSSAPTKNSDGIYGAHFWTNEGAKYYKDAPADMFSATDFAGHRIFIIPSKNLVIVRMGLNENLDFNKLIKNICASVE